MGQKTDHTIDRRSLIKRGLGAGGLAYVAPMVLSSVTPALAQSVSNPSPGCVGATCDNFIACAGNQDCFCWTIPGGGFCGTDFFCSDVATCGQGNTCPDGFVCAIGTCCGIPKCTPVSSLCTGTTGFTLSHDGRQTASGR